MSTVIQRSFTAGEISPALGARADTVLYTTGAKTVRNFIVKPEGGVENRSGTQWVSETRYSGAKKSRLLKFVFSSTQTYVLEFGHLYIRFIQNGSQIMESSKTVTAMTNANPGVFTSAAHGYSNGDLILLSFAGTSGANLSNRYFTVTAVTTNTFQLLKLNGSALNTISLGTFTSGTVARVYTVVTPYVEADLRDLHYVESADVITITHRNYLPKDLSRFGTTNWTLTDTPFVPAIAAPTGVNATGGTGAGSSSYQVTAFAADSYEESLPSTAFTLVSTPLAGSPITITWSAVSGAVEYNVYKRTAYGTYAFIGTVNTLSFVDNAIASKESETPPVARNPFVGANNYPATVSYYQQRRLYANTYNAPETVWCSRSGRFTNFTISSPLQDDDSITFSMAGRQVNEVNHLVDQGTLMVLTQQSEHTAEGGSGGVLKPLEVFPLQRTSNGSNRMQPLVINGSVLYVQQLGTAIRDFGYSNNIQNYDGDDLTLGYSHLFNKYNILAWDFQQIPNSVAYTVRDDGVLLGLTYVKSQQVKGWHRHDCGDAIIEDVCIVPEGNEHVAYYIVQRLINGEIVRYVERQATRKVVDIADSIFMDATLSYDGRNSTATTMTLSGGTLWTADEELTITSSGTFFSATDLDNAIHFTADDGSIIRVRISSYTSSTVVKGFAHKNIPSDLQGVATPYWAKAVDELKGLWHIEGETVSILADGNVVGSPYSESYNTYTVTNGGIVLDKPYSVIHVGLPYISDLETLDIESVSGETLVDKKMNVMAVTYSFLESRGGWVGGSEPVDSVLDGLTEIKGRSDEGYEDPNRLRTEKVEITIESNWNSNGRVFFRQVDPLPVTILAVVPSGHIPFQQGGR